MDDKDRFLHLEKERPSGVQERVTVSSGRFDPPAPLPAAAPLAPADSSSGSGAADRFGIPSGSMDVASEATEEQPFVRCARCEADNGRFAHRCNHCGESLDDETTRAFNQAFWLERRKGQVAEDAAHQALDQQLTLDAVKAAEDRRALAEAMARDAGAMAQGRWSSDMGEGGPPYGWVLLSGMPLLARWAVVLGLFAGPMAILAHARRGQGGALEVGAVIALGVLALLFVPPRLLRWGRFSNWS